MTLIPPNTPSRLRRNILLLVIIEALALGCYLCYSIHCFRQTRAFFKAIEYYDMRTVKSLLRGGVDVNSHYPLTLEERWTRYERIRDRARREQLNQQAQQIDVPLTQAVQAGHSFVYDNLDERLGVAQRRLAALFEALANPQ